MTASSEEAKAVQNAELERRGDVLRAIADQEVVRLTNGRLPWDSCLERAARHGRYGFINTLLIASQRPAATDVRSYNDWQEQGRQVRKGETGLRILSTRARPRAVFDIAQTTGEAIEKRATTGAEGLDSLHRLATGLDLHVDRGQKWKYLGRPERQIHIPSELDDLAAASLLAHQLAHVLLTGDQIDLPGMDPAECRGGRRVLADSIAYLVLAELGLPVSHFSFPPPRQWAGTDVRTDATAAVRVVGQQAVRTAGRFRRLLQPRTPSGRGTSKPTSQRSDATASVTISETAVRSQTSPGSPEETAGDRDSTPRAARAQGLAALADAHRYYVRHLPGSWGIHYLVDRGFAPWLQEQWELGHAPGSGTALLDHLRQHGYDDQTLIDTGLVKHRLDGKLLDVFRNRIVFPFRDHQGVVIGFIGRRRDDGKGPKYLNGSETALFKKGATLFGLHERRLHLARGTRPLLVEGPLDAIAVNATLPEDYSAVAPCGTIITEAHLDAIAASADLDTVGLVVALDGDRAGHTGAVRAWQTLRRVAGPVDVAELPNGIDPADLMSPRRQSTVIAALCSVKPLADLVIDEKLGPFEGRLQFAEVRLAAARAAAGLIAQMSPSQIARQVTRVAAHTNLDPAEITAAVTSTISPDVAADASAAGDDFPTPPLTSLDGADCTTRPTEQPQHRTRSAQQNFSGRTQ